MSAAKFQIGDHVRVTASTAYWFDQTGIVAETQNEWKYTNFVDLDDGGQVAFNDNELILSETLNVTADLVAANNAAFVAKAERKRAEKESVNDMFDDSPSIAPTLSDADKLRMIADTVDGQLPFGTELANFRKRLLAILSIGQGA